MPHSSAVGFFTFLRFWPLFAQKLRTKNLAVQLAKLNIRVNSISYGGVEGRASKEFKERYARLCPIARMLKIKEVVGAVEFLATDMSSGMIGHNLIIDGGWTIW